MQADNRFCRNCPHHKDGHIKYRYYEVYPGEIKRRTCYGNIYGVPCSCEEYVPSDNLEYLEWCVDKRSQYETSKR
jgi:hypothetical protein